MCNPIDIRRPRLAITLFLIAMTVMSSSAIAQTRDPASAEASLHWQPGPATVPLRLTNTQLRVPDGFVYITDPAELTAYLVATKNGPLTNQLAAIAPKDLSWSGVVFDAPGFLGNADSPDPLEQPGRDALLAHFQASYEEEAKTAPAGEVTIRLIGWQGTPTFRRLETERVLYLPFLVQGSDGSVYAAPLTFRATGESCVCILGQIPVALAATAMPQYQELQGAVAFIRPLPPPPKPQIHHVPNSRRDNSAWDDSFNQIGQNAHGLGKWIGAGIVVVLVAMLTVVRHAFSAIFAGCGRLFRSRRKITPPPTSEKRTGWVPPPPREGEFDD